MHQYPPEELSDHFLLAADDAATVQIGNWSERLKEETEKAKEAPAEETADVAKEKAKAKTKEAAETIDAADPGMSMEMVEEQEDRGSLADQGRELIDGFDLNNPSWDAFVALFFVVGALLYGISLGRDRIIVILVSIYMALAVVHAVPNFILNISWNNEFAFQITTFISVFVVLFFLISRSALLRTLGNSTSRGKWYQTIVFSFLHIGLLISIAMSFMPDKLINKFEPFTQTVFTNEWAVFLWIAAPIVAMIFFGSKQED